MVINHTPKEKPAGDATPPAGNTDGAIFSGRQDEDKAFATLAARFALAGHALLRADPAGGLAPYMAMRWGLVKPLASLEQAEPFLRQIGGAA